MTRQVNIIQELRNNSLTYGNEAIFSRAIVYALDGLKPAQRAVIWAAYMMGLFPNKPTQKSLKLDGFVVGNYWPHGSEYETIVRLTQPFVLNIPLLYMSGANGTQSGTPDAAASRYTEVRLSEAAEEGLLANIKKDTCEWIPNYSEDAEWPKLLPALLPNLFVNGSAGTGYCYAQSWLPGNLNEFTTKVKEFLAGKFTYEGIYPDFPTNGIIINKSEITNIYKTGTGSVTLRGKAEIDGNVIRITELPYQVYVTPYWKTLQAVAKPTFKKSKGNKQEEIPPKIAGIKELYNISGANGICIEIECMPDADPELILNKLYQYTNLQVKLSANQYAIVDGLPELMSLERYIELYVNNYLNLLVHEYTYDLRKAKDRLEIVDGLIKALDIINDIITTIKTAYSIDAAREALQSNYGFTENQAKAIVDMKLGRLAHLGIAELLDEKSELDSIVQKCEKMLASEKLQKQEFVKRLEAFTKKYGWARRTVVTDINFNYQEEMKAHKIKIKSEPTKYSIVYNSENNTIRKVKLGDFRMPKNSKTLTEVIADNKESIVFITNTGIQHKLKVKDIALSSARATGDNIDTILDLSNGTHVIAMFQNKLADKYLVFFTNTGLVKKIETNITLCVSKNAATQVMKLKADETIINVVLATDDTIFTVKSANGAKEKVRIIKCADLTAKGRSAGGVNAVKLGKNHKITSITFK